MKKLLSKASFALFIITFFAVIIYSNIYQSPFVFDDRPGIQENLDISNVANYLCIDRLLKPRDIVNLTFALNYRFGKLNVFGYHLVNVLIHVINGFLVYFLALTIFRRVFRLGAEKCDNPAKKDLKREATSTKLKDNFNHQLAIPLMSLVAALIFVAHPIQTQAVTYTVQRCASMAAMFYLASVFFYLKARIIQQRAGDGGQRTEVSGRREEHGGQRPEGRGQRSEWIGALSFRLSAFFGLSIVCGMLAFLSKQNTASLPGVILLVEYLLIDRTWEGWKRKIPWFVAVFTLWAVFVLYIAGFFSGGIEGRGLLEDVSDLMQETEYVSRWSYLCTQFNVLVIYIRLLFLPIGQNLDYVYRFNNTFFDGYTPLAFAFLVGVIAIGIWNIRKRPVISFGIFWFFITLSVESTLIPIQDAIFEHRLYLPMFGFALTISYLVFHFLSRRLSWAIVVSAIIIMSLGTATYLRNMKWKDGITLWTDVLSESPQNTRAKNNLANLLVTQGRHKEAIKYYSDVLRVEPSYMDAHVNLANVLAIQGNFDAAIQHYTAALQINPRSEKVHYNLGNALVDQGREKVAIRHFLYALSIRPGFAEAHCKLGNILIKLGDQNRAIGHFLEALRIKPYYAEAYNSLGIALVYQGKLEEAILRFREALSINPNDILVQRNLNQALKEKAQFRKEKVLPEVQNKVNSDGMLRR
ncbi:MAG: tetratricopeptide repeat protein [Desulfobacteraceae bacterium]|nr:tetratricopeptide repeat protein [Desulfobacteraceae bacterium]